MSAQGPLVSVVTPVHDTEAYLAECIESVLAQSYENFEYVIVDNACTDGSRAIADRYAASDPRIRIVETPELLPQVPNYNFALEQISPDSVYCKVVQADDWIYPECLERMVAVAERNPTAGIVSSYYLEGRRLRGVGIPPGQDHVSGQEACRLHFLQGYYVLGSPTTHMFRSEVVRAQRPFYQEDRLHEDTEACYRILTQWDLAFVHQVLSFMRVHADSITGRVVDWNPDILDKVLLVHRFAPRLLPADDAGKAIARAVEPYLRFLAGSVVALRPRRFWRYHLGALRADGLWSSRIRNRVVYYVLLELLDLVLNPKKTAGRLMRSVRERGGGPARSSRPD